MRNPSKWLYVLLLLASPAMADDCNWFRTDIKDLTTEWQVLQVRASNGPEIIEWGFDGGPNYPVVITHHTCGPGWITEIRVGKECVEWVGYRSVTGSPCVWTEWIQIVPGKPLPPHLEGILG